MNWRIATVIPLSLMLTGCAKQLPRADLGVDIYLHPEAASADDILLQAAIHKKIAESLAGRAGLVHVRSIDKVIFLSGSVNSDDDRKKAVDAAQNIDIRIDGQAIKPAGEIHSERLVVTRPVALHKKITEPLAGRRTRPGSLPLRPNNAPAPSIETRDG